MADNLDDQDYTIDSADAGASMFYPMQCSALRKGGHVLINNRPCKIISMSTSKTGKHGHAKVHLVGEDIFTKKKLEDLCPSTHNKDVPNVTRTEYAFLNLEDGFLSLYDDVKGEPRDDVKMPDPIPGDDKRQELIDKINEFNTNDAKQGVVIVVTSMGEHMAMDAKEV